MNYKISSLHWIAFQAPTRPWTLGAMHWSELALRQRACFTSGEEALAQDLSSERERSMLEMKRRPYLNLPKQTLPTSRQNLNLRGSGQRSKHRRWAAG